MLMGFIQVILVGLFKAEKWNGPLYPCWRYGDVIVGQSRIIWKKAVVIGRSFNVGMPQALLLSAKGSDATVTVVHSRTTDAKSICKEADIVVAAVGSPEMVKADWIKPGAVVIDVGINRVDDDSREIGWRLAGDVDPEVFEVASLISPVPGGVGPMTVAMLMANTVAAAKGQH